MTTENSQKSYFDVLGLCCSSEIPLIEKILKPMDGVREVSVIVASRTVIVVHDNLVVSQLQIVNALNQARLEANIRAYGEVNYINKWPSPYAIACGAFLLLSLLKYVYDPLKWFAIVSVVVGIVPIILKGYAALRNFTLDTNILVLIAVMGSIALRDYWEAASIVFLFTIAQWLESRASHKATAVMSSLMNMVPQKAVIAETGEEVDASEVMIDTILAVKPGENIPIDGVVVDGKCEVDEKTLTGESFPVFKKVDSIVWAGTINLDGYIRVKTTALAEDCAVAKMAKLVEEAQNNKSKTQRFIDKCAKFYTPAIMGISIGLAAIPAILKVNNQRHWFHLALVVLVSACPCALILSTPVATFCALSKAATSGLLIKGGDYLETLSKIKIMGFDKTGTITRGEFVVTEFQSIEDSVSLNTMLYWVASIESKSSHPMASALIDYGRSLSIEPKPENVEDFENFPGEGVSGKIEGKDIFVGNRKIASRAGCELVPSMGGIGEGKSIGYIFLGGVLAGVFSVSDTCRTGAKEAINELKSIGIRTAMLTGDSTEAATLAQNQLEGALDVIDAELLPQDKANIIKEFQKQAPTAMVGDGLNDAPALATADIGISMGVSGSALATETGHVILMSNDITKIPFVIKLARKTQMKVVQNVVISILTKVAILALAFAGYPLVWAAVLVDVGTCLVVILNSMLLLKGKEERAKRSCKLSWMTIFRKKGCVSHSHRNHDCQNHNHDHSHEQESLSGVHLLNGSKPCHGHTNGCFSHTGHSKETKHGHTTSLNPSHSHGNDNCHNHKHDHSHEHESSSDVHKHHCSKPCDGHAKDSNPSQTNDPCTHVDHLIQKKYSSVDHSTRSNVEHKRHCSTPCDGHEKGSNFSIKKGCCEHVADPKGTKFVSQHRHHSTTKTCDGPANSINPRQTNECCAQKDQVKEVNHMHDHDAGCNDEHKHFFYSDTKSYETEKCIKFVEKHTHNVEIGEGHSDHLSPDEHCHSAHCIPKHEENCCVHDKVADDFGNKYECMNQNENTECSSLHKRRECGATKVCSINSENRHIARCCRSLGEKCCNRTMGFKENVGGLSEIVVQ